MTKMIRKGILTTTPTDNTNHQCKDTKNLISMEKFTYKMRIHYTGEIYDE